MKSYSSKKQPKKEKFKFEFTKKNIAIILAVALGLVFITASLFIVDSFSPANPKVYHRWFVSTFAGSFDGKDTPNTYHQIEIKQDAETGEPLYSCVNLTLNPTNNTKAKEIWINFSDLYASELTVFLGYGHTINVQHIVTKTFTEKQVRANEDGWFLLYSSTDGLSLNGERSIKIGFSANVKFREIYFVGLTNKIGTAVDSCSYGLKPTKEESVDHVKASKSDADNVVDEPTTFRK